MGSGPSRKSLDDTTWIDKSGKPKYYTKLHSLGITLKDLESGKTEILHTHPHFYQTPFATSLLGKTLQHVKSNEILVGPGNKNPKDDPLTFSIGATRYFKYENPEEQSTEIDPTDPTVVDPTEVDPTEVDPTE